MVPKNLFTGQQWRKRHREQTYGRGKREGEDEMYGKSNMETYINICKIQPTGICCMAQETQTGALLSTQRGGMWWAMEGGPKERGYILIHVEV